MLKGFCARCKKESEGHEPEMPEYKDGLTEQEIKRQDHIMRQRKKQTIWVVPDD
jgi:hypothetical protein